MSLKRVWLLCTNSIPEVLLSLSKKIPLAKCFHFQFRPQFMFAPSSSTLKVLFFVVKISAFLNEAWNAQFKATPCKQHRQQKQRQSLDSDPADQEGWKPAFCRFLFSQRSVPKHCNLNFDQKVLKKVMIKWMLKLQNLLHHLEGSFRPACLLRLCQFGVKMFVYILMVSVTYQ